MRTEDGVFCDANDRKCKRPAISIHSCQVEGSEFAFCAQHKREFDAVTQGKTHLQIRCPRCIPGFLQKLQEAGQGANSIHLPSPITGPIAEAIDEAMYREGILGPTRLKVLRRLNNLDDSYVAAIFRSTAAPKAQAQVQTQVQAQEAATG